MGEKKEDHLAASLSFANLSGTAAKVALDRVEADRADLRRSGRTAGNKERQKIHLCMAAQSFVQLMIER